MPFTAGQKLRATDLEALRRTTPTTAAVATSQTTTSTSYVDLGTVGPLVTVDTGTTARVTIGNTMSNSAGNHAAMAFAISGATTVAASDSFGMYFAGTVALRGTSTYLVTGLTPGSNTFTAKYRVNIAGTGTFADRNIIVEPV